MADILIKNMEMPKNCLSCPMKEHCQLFNALHFNERLKMLDVSIRVDGCPLVALPEHHGRLGDLDLVEEWMRKKHKEHDCPFNIDAFLFALKKIPTIVEANNGTDN